MAGQREAPPSILIFGINYAPERTGVALNTTGLAGGLAALGWDITVSTGVPHYPSWRREPIPKRDPKGPVKVIHRSHYVPARPTVLRRAAYEGTWTASSLRSLLPGRRLDLVVGIVPSVGGAALAAAAALRYRVPYVVMFQDLIGRAALLSGLEGATKVAGWVRGVETGFARRAAAVGIVAESFRMYLVDAGVAPEKIFRFRNPVRLSNPNERRDVTRERFGWAPDEFIVLHTGSMGYKQGLENLIEAADLAKGRPDIRFVLQGDGNQRLKLQEMARVRGLTNVVFQGLVPESDLANTLAAADALLLNQRASVCNMSLPAKLGLYFAAGVPVIAAVAEQDETATEVAAAQAGIRIDPDEPMRLLEAILELKGSPQARVDFGASGARFAAIHLNVRDAVLGIAANLERARARQDDLSDVRST